MGEISDDILDGIFCEICGAFIDDKLIEWKDGAIIAGPGFPRKCKFCKKRELTRKGGDHE